MKHVRWWGHGAAILLALVAAGCGGGGGSSGSSNPPPSNVIITISPASQTVGYGSTQQFTAKVTGSTNTAVTWSVSSSGSTSSSQIGSISSSGLYTAPAATSVPAAGSAPQMVTVTGGQAVTSADITVPPLNSIDTVTVTATSQADSSKSSSATVTLSGLSILALGQCTPTSATQLSCSAGSTGTQISTSQSGGQTVYLFVAGYGILPGTSYEISSNGADVIVTQPTSAGGNFSTTSSGLPAVYFPVIVSPTATPGPRNLVVTNQGNELTSFAGAVNITQ
ncbi:MAG TPA: hypothetical protein VJW77_07540 [Terriglobia bacterium]|nr:hypothetical protein [Terriglobia bacterium]